MTSPLRKAAPFAAGLGALLASPLSSVWSSEAETHLASNDRAPRIAARPETLPSRPKTASVLTAPAAEPSREVFTSPVWAQVSADMVNARSGAGTQFPIVSTLRGGDYVRAVARVGGWIEMAWPDSAPAWVSQDFVKPDGTVTGSNVRLRSGGNLNASILAEAGKGDKLEILGTAGGWYKVKAPANAKAFIFARYLILGVRPPDGPAAPVAPPAPEAEPKAPFQPVATNSSEPAPARAIASPSVEMPATESAHVAEVLPEPAAPEIASLPAPEKEIEIPKMDIAARATVALPDSDEADKPAPNNPPILELLAEESRDVPVVPLIVLEVLPQETAAAETLAEPAVSAKTPSPAPEVALQTALAPPPPEIPTTQPEPKTIRSEPAQPPEEILWGDELPPPKRVKILPGPRTDPAKDSSQAPLPAPAQREGGLVMGLVADLAEQPAEAVTTVRAEVVDVPQIEPQPEPKQIVRPHITRTPILPVPAGEAPLAIRLPAVQRTLVGSVNSERIQEAEGLLEACVASPMDSSGCELRTDDGTVWYLANACDGFAEAFLGARVRVVGSTGTYPNADGGRVLYVKQIALIP
ncbi:MAG: SH3 domain-containing protein [Planctomycetes bacterium]|nr:SH3 domain-containing protein [Planctomycetota bacterium]